MGVASSRRGVDEDAGADEGKGDCGGNDCGDEGLGGMPIPRALRTRGNFSRRPWRRGRVASSEIRRPPRRTRNDISWGVTQEMEAACLISRAR